MTGTAARSTRLASAPALRFGLCSSAPLRGAPGGAAFDRAAQSSRSLLPHEAAITRVRKQRGNPMTEAKTLTKADLRQFTGSEHWYRHSLSRAVLYTDGAKYVADTAGAYWLLDEIAFTQRSSRRVAAEQFQLWKLSVKPDQTATLVCEDGNGTTVYTKMIEYTDFPLDAIDLYFIDNTILLPSEY